MFCISLGITYQSVWPCVGYPYLKGVDAFFDYSLNIQDKRCLPYHTQIFPIQYHLCNVFHFAKVNLDNVLGIFYIESGAIGNSAAEIPYSRIAHFCE